MRNTALALASVMALSLTVPAAASFAGYINSEAFDIFKMGAVGEVEAAFKAGKVNLTDRDANGETGLMIVAKWNLPENLQFLVNAGGKVNDRNLEGLTPLMLACINNENPEIIEVLCRAGADVNAIDKHGRTALMYAAEYTNPDVMRVLLAYGADPFAMDDQMRTIQEFAVASRIQFNIEETNKILAVYLKRATVRISGVFREVGTING